MADDTNDDGDDWRFSLDDLAEDGNGDDAVGFSLHGEVESGSPSVENALFVALGFGLGLVVVVQLFL
ncbi:MAG: hypothetical protein ABEJ47_03160 [Halorhabdus sp.]